MCCLIKVKQLSDQCEKNQFSHDGLLCVLRCCVVFNNKHKTIDNLIPRAKSWSTCKLSLSNCLWASAHMPHPYLAQSEIPNFCLQRQAVLSFLVLEKKVWTPSHPCRERKCIEKGIFLLFSNKNLEKSYKKSFEKSMELGKKRSLIRIKKLVLYLKNMLYKMG